MTAQRQGPAAVSGIPRPPHCDVPIDLGHACKIVVDEIAHAHEAVRMAAVGVGLAIVPTAGFHFACDLAEETGSGPVHRSPLVM